MVTEGKKSSNTIVALQYPSIMMMVMLMMMMVMLLLMLPLLLLLPLMLLLHDDDRFDAVCMRRPHTQYLYPHTYIQIILSSDKISTLQKPIFLLKLDLVDEQGQEKEVVVEMDRQELQQVVSQLDDVHKVGR